MEGNIMEYPELIGLISSIASLILAVIAIWLSLWFYSKSKESEARIQDILVRISSETSSLQRLAGGWIQNLTEYATNRNPANEAMRTALNFVQERGAHVAEQGARELESAKRLEQYTNEMISLYIICYYYASLSNFFAVACLPKKIDYDSSNSFHVVAKNASDSSVVDFYLFQNIVSKISQNQLDSCPHKYLFDETETLWKGLVKSSAQHWSKSV